MWGESPLYENGILTGGSIPNVNRPEEVLGEGNRGEATNRGEEARGWMGKRRVCLSPPGCIHAKAARATNRNAIQAKRDPEVSCTWTAKPFPTEPTVDGELVERKFTFLFGEICDAYP